MKKKKICFFIINEIFENFNFENFEKNLNFLISNKKKNIIFYICEIFIRLIFFYNFFYFEKKKNFEIEKILIKIFFKAFSFCKNKELNFYCEINEKSFWFFLVLLNNYKNDKIQNQEFLIYIKEILNFEKKKKIKNFEKKKKIKNF